jgi:Flp pilus assembly pilin Flp
LSRIIKWRVNRQNPDRGVTVVDFSLMVGLLAIVLIVAVGLGVLGSN